MTAALRRLFDLQAASIWRDLEEPLSVAQGVVLDVGAGAQPYRALVNEAAMYRAIDTARAGADFGYEVAGTEYFDGETWPATDESVDVVLATETLEHVLDPALFLGEARRVVRSGGRIVLTVPFSARWHFIPNDYWRFTPSGLSVLLQKAGFTNVVVHARGNEVTVAAAKCMALILPLLMPQQPGLNVARRAAGLLLAPALILLALIGQVSLRSPGGDDCLGYTVHALAP